MHFTCIHSVFRAACLTWVLLSTITWANGQRYRLNDTCQFFQVKDGKDFYFYFLCSDTLYTVDGPREARLNICWDNPGSFILNDPADYSNSPYDLFCEQARLPETRKYRVTLQFNGKRVRRIQITSAHVFVIGTIFRCEIRDNHSNLDLYFLRPDSYTLFDWHRTNSHTLLRLLDHHLHNQVKVLY